MKETGFEDASGEPADNDVHHVRNKHRVFSVAYEQRERDFRVTFSSVYIPTAIYVLVIYCFYIGSRVWRPEIPIVSHWQPVYLVCFARIHRPPKDSGHSKSVCVCVEM